MREINFQELAMLLGSALLEVKEYEPTEEENALAYQNVIERMHQGRSSSILIEGFSLFHNPQFISLLRANIGKSHLRLEMIVCSPLFSKPDQEITKPTLVDNPSEIVFREIESGFLDPTEGKKANHVVTRAIESGLLNLMVEPEELVKLREPNSIIVDDEELFIEQVHREGKVGKSWYLESPFGYLRRYKDKRSQFREKAKIIRV